MSRTCTRIDPDYLASLLDLARQGELVKVIHGVYQVFDVDLTDPDGPKIDPTDYAIPEDQWGDISKALGEGSSGLGSVNVMLDWMNVGPSGYDDS